jgi:hypothetical protein
MPLPIKQEQETDNDFISRCAVKVADEFPSMEQRLAVCYSQLEKFKMSKEEDKDTYVVQPRRKESRGVYLKRCSANSKMRESYPMMKERMGYCLNAYSEYYRWWGKFEDTDIPADSALGRCIARKRATGTDYKQAYRECASKVVVPNTPIVMSDNLLIEPVEFSEMSVLGYNTKYFYICPGAQATFDHLISMNPDEETAGMIRSAAQIADNVFQIEAKVLEDKTATTEQLNQAEILVDDFYDLIDEIDEELGMIHDVSYMDGHIDLIESYINK